MKNRDKVFVQIQNKKTGHWQNCKAADTYEDALGLMEQEKQKWPLANFRVLKPNLYDHTK